jgi:hypothetical protein
MISPALAIKYFANVYLKFLMLYNVLHNMPLTRRLLNNRKTTSSPYLINKLLNFNKKIIQCMNNTQ